MAVSYRAIRPASDARQLAGALLAAVDARFAVLFGGALAAANALLPLTSRRLRAIS